MATQGGIADGLLINLAEDVETAEQVEALGRALGFKSAAINRYTETNIKGDRVTYKGTRDMLFDWRQTVEPSYQHLKLKQALIEAKLVVLADTYLNETAISPDIDKKITESFTISQCREKLKNVYLNELCKIPMKPWDRNDYAEFKNMHTLVTMVKKDAHGKDTRKKEILEGSVSEIFSTKVNSALPARILISAPAGRGKTTAVAKIAYDWAHRVQGSALELLPLLFVLKFRNTDKEMSIGEAIKSQLLSDVEDLTPDDLERFISKNQNICHIILDGLDEYAGIAANRGLGSNIVDVMLWKTYRECRVLVTTRPHLESFFNQGNLPTVYTKMWIEGFSPKSSRDYIDKFFASNSKSSAHVDGDDLKVYLDGQPLINELVITPLFCLMVCHLWSEGLLGRDTTTQTELLDSVNLFLMHHANNRSQDKITERGLGEIVCKLGQVALAGLLDDAKKLVFTPHDFRKVPSIIDKACELGIISKTTVTSTRLPKASETTSTTIEFYHKLAQEHSAGKNLADQTNKYLLRCRISKLDRVLRKIKENIGEYENLIRFAAGTDNRLCIRIMEGLLSNSFLDESERYRILLDCSSETLDTEGGSVSSMVQRCVTAERMVLKSPTVYTVVGMQKLPDQLKSQIREVKFEESSISTDVTSGLWSSLGSFPTLQNLTISDSSLSFPVSTPVLPPVTKLVAERVTSHSYEGLLSSLTGVEEIEITVDDAERDIPHITAGLRGLRGIGGQQLTRIALEAPISLQPEKKEVSRATMRGLGVLIEEQTKNLKMLALSGVNSGDEGDLVDLCECCRHVKSLDCLLLLSCGSERGGRLESYAKDLLISNERFRVLILHEMSVFVLEKYQLSTEMTIRLWSSLRSSTSLSHLFISDSSLSFPPSPPELTSITKLEAERVTSQSYEGLLSSLPGLKEIDITIDDAESDISQITAGLRRTRRHRLTTLRIEAPAPLPLEKKNVSSQTMRGLGLLIRKHVKNLESLSVSGVKCIDEDFIDLIESSKILPSLHFQFLGRGSLEYTRTYQVPTIKLGDCQLSTDMTIKLWTCLRSFPSLGSLTISDSSLSFPPSLPELTTVIELKAERVTSQSYEGLLSSLPGLKEIDITIDDAERDISRIMAGLRQTGGQKLKQIYLHASEFMALEKMAVSRETMRGLGLLIREQTKNLRWLGLDRVETDEEDLVHLIECCRHVKAMGYAGLYRCGTKAGGRLESHLKSLDSSGGRISVAVYHDIDGEYYGRIPTSTELLRLLHTVSL